jgi:murein DD-endopeptidase MepM/ murein hydrolase activator NlpD
MGIRLEYGNYSFGDKEIGLAEGFRQYKRKEKLFYARLVSGAKAVFHSLVGIPGKLFAWAGRGTVIAFIPESEAPSRRFRIARILALAAVLGALGLGGFSIYATSRYALLAARHKTTQERLNEALAAVDTMRDKAEVLTGRAMKFEDSLSGLLSLVEGTPGTDALDAAGLGQLLNRGESQTLAYREIERLEGVARYLDEAVPGLEKASSLLSGQKEIMTEIPNIWPIKGGIGHISMYFGQNENPFSAGQWYLHSGIDISTFRQGDPVVAAADGKVIGLGYDPGLGNSVTIQHSHGFLTRYAHLRTFRVAKGQQVSQGQIIGSVGNTGKSTGPHLHYEVHLGTSIIDPLRFLNVRRTAK